MVKPDNSTVNPNTVLPIGENITRKKTCLHDAFYQIAKRKLFAIRNDIRMFVPAKHALCLFMHPENIHSTFHPSGSPFDEKILVERVEMALSFNNFFRKVDLREMCPIQTTCGTRKGQLIA